MAKFKVGDKVTLKEGFDGGILTHGKEYEVKSVSIHYGEEWIHINIDDKDSTINGWRSKRFEYLKAKPEPVDLKVLRDIVSGDYGRLCISPIIRDGDDDVNMAFIDRETKDGVMFSNFNLDELREMAHIINQVIEAIESEKVT